MCDVSLVKHVEDHPCYVVTHMPLLEAMESNQRSL